MLRGSGLYNVHGVYIIGTEEVVSSVCGPMSRHRILIALDRPWARNEHGHLVEKCNYKFLNNPPRLTIELLYKNFSFTRPVNWSPVNAQKSFGPHSTGPLINWSNQMPWSPGPQSKTKWSQGFWLKYAIIIIICCLLNAPLINPIETLRIFWWLF